MEGGCQNNMFGFNGGDNIETEFIFNYSNGVGVNERVRYCGRQSWLREPSLGQAQSKVKILLI